jgi:hypothetical protein
MRLHHEDSMSMIVHDCPMCCHDFLSFRQLAEVMHCCLGVHHELSENAAFVILGVRMGSREALESAFPSWRILSLA